MHEIVKDYYGTQLQSTEDLRTTACCDFTTMPEWMKVVLAKIHPDVLARYYGCGLVAPPLLRGCRVLDLGCGTGRDVYALAQLVGAQGSVVGVDMTPEQLAVAERYRNYHREAFGYAQDNVEFHLGYIENLNELGLADASFDVVVSNCVVNLSPDKDAVLREVHRLLKPGGEFYFSDIYANRRVPDRVRNDPLLYGECLGGALYGNDFHDLARRHGFDDPRLVESRPISITDPKLALRAEGIGFYSATYRLFKLDGLETQCEDYGQAVIYQGTIEEHPHGFMLDDHHFMQTGRVFPVCGNTWHMLHDTRMREHFQFIGDFSRHFGLFDCAPDPASNNSQTAGNAGACC
jgi:SAM-dependent methyltransferase